MNNILIDKYNKLIEIIRKTGRLAIAFSGGVDSSFLLYSACEALGGDNVLAITVKSDIIPERELAQTKELCAQMGVRHEICNVDPFAVDGFKDNPVNRCYICKRNLFGKMIELANAYGIALVAEGSNKDDEGDYRPGLKAVEELGVISPLREAGLCKAEIRELSKEYGLATWDKPSFACLASRFAYGETITKEKLTAVNNAEQLLMDMGFRQFRVRLHGNIARIEVEPFEIERIVMEENREFIVTEFRKLGFDYVALDLTGYRTGSMNEVLDRA